MYITRSDQEWITIFEDQKASGLSIKEFCSRNGISKKSFYGARSRIIPVSDNSSGPAILPVRLVSGKPSCSVVINGTSLSFDPSLPSHIVEALVRGCRS